MATNGESPPPKDGQEEPVSDDDIPDSQIKNATSKFFSPCLFSFLHTRLRGGHRGGSHFGTPHQNPLTRGQQ